jgi:hypothetical protein
MVVTADGRRLGMFTYRTIKFVSGVAESQIVQHAPDRFTVRYVAAGDESDPLRLKREVTDVFASVLGYVPEVDLERVQTIERGSNGKLRTVIRTFKETAGPVGENAR